MLSVFTANPYYKVDYYHDVGIEDAGQHQHPFFEIFYFISGTVRYALGEQQIKICPGDILFIDKDTRHYPIVTGRKTYNRYVLRISPELITRVSSPQTNLSRCFHTADAHMLLLRPDIETHKRVLDLMKTLLSIEDQTTFGVDIQQQICVLELMLLLNSVEQKVNLLVQTAEKKQPPLLQSIKEYIAQNLTSELTLDGIANYFFISKSHLCHMFQSKEKQTVYHYICAGRIDLAKRLIAQEYSIQQVAYHCGFQDYAAFYRAFRAEESMSPRAYYQSLHGKQ